MKKERNEYIDYRVANLIAFDKILEKLTIESKKTAQSFGNANALLSEIIRTSRKRMLKFAIEIIILLTLIMLCILL